MASPAANANTKLSNYNTSYSNFKSSRNSLLSTISGYSGNVSTGLIIESKTGKEFWIIFVKQRTLKTDGGNYYDIDIKGTGFHIIFNSVTSASNIISACSSIPSASFVNNIVKLEFYGPDQLMSINSVIQRGTLSAEDDISDIADFTKTRFDNLCMGIVENCTIPLS